MTNEDLKATEDELYGEDGGNIDNVYDKYLRRKTLKEHIEDQIKRSPWWLIAIVLHAVVIAILMNIAFMTESPREERIIVQTEMFEDIPKPEQKDILKDILEEKEVEVDSDVQAPDVEDPAPNPEVEVENVSIADISDDLAELGEISEMGLGNVGSLGGAGDSGALAGMLGHGNGTGGLGKGAKVKYMGTESKGRHFAFLIDYSKSLKKSQIEVAKYELKKAIKSFDPNARVALIFFSGPAWVPQLNNGNVGGYVNDLRVEWDSKGFHDFWLKPGKKYDTPRWIAPTAGRKKLLTTLIDETPTSGGTDWRHPFNMAYAMHPKPDVIYFMTDGKCKGSDETIDMVKRNKRIVVNTIAFGLEDKDAEPLEDMAKLTKGKFKSYTMDQITKMFQDIGGAKK